MAVNNKKEEYNEVPLGLEVKSKNEVLVQIKKKLSSINQKIKYSSIYNNFWLLNIVFLNLLIAVVATYFISKNYSNLPQNIGVSLFGNEDYDTLLDKSYLFGIGIIHVLFAVITLIFSFKAQKKLNHLYIIGFLNYIVLIFFEFYALRDLINFYS